MGVAIHLDEVRQQEKRPLQAQLEREVRARFGGRCIIADHGQHQKSLRPDYAADDVAVAMESVGTARQGLRINGQITPASRRHLSPIDTWCEMSFI
jgi:hypothetical protein